MNANLAWATWLVDALARSGLRAVCVAPGSRSTPLTLAFDRHPEIDVFLHLDERGAGFFALGMALATDRPVALVCTSGTAAAEFFAAIIEAKQSHVPLLVLTSDRPHELRHSGANQTIDQVKLYGDQVLWSVDLPVPDADADAVETRNLVATAARAYAVANGLVKGPVHLNMPFRKPLEPATLDELDQLPGAPESPVIRTGKPATDAETLAEIARHVNDAPRGLIVCGPRCPGGDFPAAVADLARRTGYPIMADPLAGVRYGPQTDGTPIAGTYESFLNTPRPPWDDPQMIIRFGAVPTSKWLNAYLGRVQTPVRVHVRANGIWADDAHHTTHFVQADEAAFCRGLTEMLTRPPTHAWTAAVMAAEQAARAVAEEYFAAQPFDGSVMAALVDALPPDAQLFVGSSLPVRHLDQFGTVRRAPLHVYANRGASGIDGVTSSALGVAAAHPDAPTVLAIGDVSFIHDLNGLLAVRQLGLKNVTIVLFNNDGGGIFRRLPVANLEPAFTPLFLTPHGLDFAHAAALFGLEHQVCTDLHAFPDQLHAAMTSPATTILEVRTDSVEDLNHQRALVRRIVETEKTRLGD